MNLFVLKSWLQAKFAKDEQGANLVEYILLVALIALAVIAAVVFLRGQVNSKFDQTGSKLSSGGWSGSTQESGAPVPDDRSTRGRALDQRRLSARSAFGHRLEQV